MAIKKDYSKDKKVCKVTFTIPKELYQNFNEVSLVGDFNDWDPNKNKFCNKLSDGSSEIELVLEAGKEYSFRYLCDHQLWLNEPDADKQVPTHYGDSKNSVLVI